MLHSGQDEAPRETPAAAPPPRNPPRRATSRNQRNRARQSRRSHPRRPGSRPRPLGNLRGRPRRPTHLHPQRRPVLRTRLQRQALHHRGRLCRLLTRRPVQDQRPRPRNPRPRRHPPRRHRDQGRWRPVRLRPRLALCGKNRTPQPTPPGPRRPRRPDREGRSRPQSHRKGRRRRHRIPLRALRLRLGLGRSTVGPSTTTSSIST